MKKINLLNKTISHLSAGYGFSPFQGKGVRLNSRGGWDLPRRTPCATPSWKEGERKVPSYRRMPVSRGFNRGGGIPLFSGMTAVIFALCVATPSFATPTELDKKTVASKAYVDTKQDIIPAVSLDTNTSDPITAPVVGYPSVDDGQIIPRLVLGYNGEYSLKKGDSKIESWMRGDDFVGGGYAGTSNLTEIEAQNALPTLKYLRDVMWPRIEAKQDELNAKLSNARDMAVTRGSSSGITSSAYITAGGSVGLTTRSGAPAVINYVNGTATDLATFTTGTFGTNNSTNQNYINGALVSLELLKDVYSALHNEIQNATPTGTPGNVAIYDPTTGELGDGVATYDGSTTYNASTDADKIAVMSGVQRKKECGGYEPGHENDPDYCWLWILPD